LFFRLASLIQTGFGFVLIFILATSPSVKKRKDLCLFLLTEVGGFKELSVFNMDRSSNVGVVQQDNRSFEFNGESDLDLEYAMALTDPTPVTLLQTGDLIQGLSLGNRDGYILLIPSLNL